MSTTRKLTTPRPTRKADKETYDLLHRAWRAGVVDDFRYGTDRNSLAVLTDDASGTLGWTVDVGDGPTFLADHDAVDLLLADTLATFGVTSIEWGARWCGYRHLTVNYVDQTAVA